MAQTHDGFLLWGSAPTSEPKPLPVVRVEPSTFHVVSHRHEHGERIINATVAGKAVTVVIPLDVLAALEHEWNHVNTTRTTGRNR